MIEIDIIETSGLGDRSYLATDGEVAVVIDPQRDIDRVMDLVEKRGVRISHVLETHIHNDYVTGGLELARSVDAQYVVSGGEEVAYNRTAVNDADVIEAGSMRLRVLHTPGHTPHHLSFALTDEKGHVRGVFTGGSMLYGSTGRTDLVGPEYTHSLTHAQFQSVRRLASELPPETEVFPTHGFGSFCSATPTTGNASSVGDQFAVNPALTMDEQEYVDNLLAGFDAYPAYYAHMARINRQGAAPVDLSMPDLVDPSDLRQRIEAGEWVVDLRERNAFAAGHLAGSLGFELSTAFVTYLGWLYRLRTPLTLLAETPEQVADAQRELVRIGIDNLSGAATGDVTTLGGGGSLRSYLVASFAGLAEERQKRDVQVLDARLKSERVAGHVRDSLHIPLHQLLDRIEEVPQGEVWVYCGSGYRASIAASFLDRLGRQPVLVNDGFDGSKAAGLFVEPNW